jgi:uncharacterized protein YdeI (YjbR/CyaY-like superfamily)
MLRYFASMEITETLHAQNRKKWRAWLTKHHSSKKEIWLVYYKPNSGKGRIPYGDAVEEAICFGWIDSTVKRIDEDRYCQRYTPRNPKSIWSYANVRRLKKMLDAGLMTPAGLKVVPTDVMEAVRSGRIEKKGPVIPKVLDEPEDLTAALAANAKAKANWEKFPPSHRKMRIYWVLDAKKPETRERRIGRVVQMARENRRDLV